MAPDSTTTVNDPQPTETRVASAQHREGTVVRETARPAWSPVQFVVLVAGLLLVVLGGVGLAKAGTSFANIPLTHTTVAGLSATTLSALVELVVGVILLATAAWPDAAKSSAAVLGAVMLAFGLIVAFAPRPFFNMWAYTRANGIFFVVVGAILLLTAAVSPVFWSRRHTSVQRTSSGTPVTDPTV